MKRAWARVRVDRKRGRIHPYICGQFMDYPLDVTLVLEGSAWEPSAARLRLLSADSPFARNDFAHPHRLAIEERTVSPGVGAGQLELPAHCVGALLLE